MNEMALIVPSRGRPKNIERLYESLQDTKAKVDMFVGVDADDESLDEYRTIVKNTNINLMVSPERSRFGPTLNNIAVQVAEYYKYLSWMGDDHLPRTKYWDERYRIELDRVKAGIVYGNDLFQGQNIPTQMGFTSNIVMTLGYAVPKGFIHLYIDNYFLELGKAIDGVSYLDDVIIEHLHPYAQKAEEDRTYREANSKENWSNDKIRFHQYIQEELQRDANKIKELIL